MSFRIVKTVSTTEGRRDSGEDLGISRSLNKITDLEF